jgi:hypothetical protein
MKLNTLSSQTNEEIPKELPEYPNLRTHNNQKILNFKKLLLCILLRNVI